MLFRSPVAEQEIGKQLLLETVAYAESAMCRRKQLLHYFGEIYENDNCKSCDNCLHPKDRFEGMEYICIALDAILKVKEKFKAKHIVNVLLGKTTSEIKSYKHNQLDIFGRGADEDEQHWNAVIRQALVKVLLIKDIENYGLLHLSQNGHEYLKNPTSIMLAKDHDYESIIGDEEEEMIGMQKGGGVDTVLFALLRDLRKDVARKHNVPPYVVFQDPSLEDMTIHYPISMDEMNQIAGVGPGKARKFGNPFIELIANYVKENEIERPVDMIVKSVINKSGLKVYIIQNIDRKLPLNDIAASKGISMEAFISELESIVSSGTNVNINYYIDQVMDEEHLEEILSYFKETETDSIKAALDELRSEERRVGKECRSRWSPYH